MSTTTQTLESIGKAADAFGDIKISEMKFSFTIKTTSDGKSDSRIRLLMNCHLIWQCAS